MRQSTWVGGCVVLVALATGAQALAQRARPSAAPSAAPSASADAPRHISIPVGEAVHMMNRLRVYPLRAPDGATAFGLGTLGPGQHLWVLLPSCRQPNPDDPRDPCPVGRVTIETMAGTGAVQSTEPMPVVAGQTEGRRVQSFSVPAGVTQVRVKILRRDDAVRYEVNIEATQLHHLDLPEGHAEDPAHFTFELGRYIAS